MNKKIITMALALVMSIGFCAESLACTAVYVGKDVSSNGSAFVSRTEDIGSAHPKSFVTYEAMDHPEGSKFVDVINGFEYPQLPHTYKYCAVPDSLGNDDDGIYDEVGFNENGVIVTATVSAYYNEHIEKIDPLIDNGIREASIGTILLQRAKTARDGIEILAKIIDEKGAAECNSLMVADHNEVWYMEIVSGHQYVAIKMPTDKVAVMPNTLMLDYVDVNSKDTIASKDLISLPAKHNLNKNVDGKFSVRATYGVELQDYDRSRLWGGTHYLAPSKNLKYDADQYDYKLFFTPDKKISLKDVMGLQKYRYEGTELDVTKKGNEKVRVIGTPTSTECHIIELKNNFPYDAPGILWLALANCEHNIYVPFFPNLTKTPEAYALKSGEFNMDQAYWAFRGVATLAELNREKYGKGVREYFENYQDELIKSQEKRNNLFLTYYHQDKDKSVKYANEMAEKLGNEAYNKAKDVYAKLFKYIAKEAGKPNKEPFKVK